MLFDTDILIWIEKGNLKAAGLVDRNKKRYISTQTYMELLQCAQNKQQQNMTKKFLFEFDFKTIPFSPEIGYRASIYIEKYSLSHGLRAGDAIVASTSIESGLPLCSSNIKHYKFLKELELKAFKP